MNAKRELSKLLKAIEELGMNRNDVAEKAGHSRYYFAATLGRIKKDPNANIWANPIKHIWEIVHQEQAKRAVAPPGKPEAMQAAKQAWLTPKDLIALIDQRCKSLGILPTTVCRSMGLSGNYYNNNRRRVADPKHKFRQRAIDTLQLVLLELDKYEGKGKDAQLELKFDEPAMRLVFDDDSSALPVAMPPPKPVAKPMVTGEDTLRGLIHKQLDKMGVVQLALLLAHIVGNE